MKKILYVVTQSEFGGAQQFLRQLLSSLDRSRFHPFVAASKEPGDIFPFLEEQGISCFPLLSLQRPLSLVHDFRAVKELRALLRKLKPDILHLLSSKAGFLGSIAGRLEKVPSIVYRIGGFAFYEHVSRLKKMAYFLAEWGTSFFKDRIIVNNPVDLMAIERLHLGIKKSMLIPNGFAADFSVLSKEDARNQLQIPNKSWVIGTIANFYPNKNITLLIEAVKNLVKGPLLIPQLRCVIIGDGLERPRIEDRIRQENLGEQITLLGKKENASQYLKAFDTFVLPSQKEGMPWSILEAFAAKVPVIATNVGGVPFVMNPDQEGILVPPKDPLLMAKAIQRLWQNTEFRMVLAEKAFERLQKDFSLQRMVKSIEACYDHL